MILLYRTEKNVVSRLCRVVRKLVRAFGWILLVSLYEGLYERVVRLSDFNDAHIYKLRMSQHEGGGGDGGREREVEDVEEVEEKLIVGGEGRMRRKEEEREERRRMKDGGGGRDGGTRKDGGGCAEGGGGRSSRRDKEEAGGRSREKGGGRLPAPGSWLLAPHEGGVVYGLVLCLCVELYAGCTWGLRGGGGCYCWGSDLSTNAEILERDVWGSEIQPGPRS